MGDDIDDRIHIRRGFLGIRFFNRRRDFGRIRRIGRNRKVSFRFHIACHGDGSRRSRTIVDRSARQIRRPHITALGFLIPRFFCHSRLNRKAQIIIDRTVRRNLRITRRRFHFCILSDGHGRCGCALIHQNIHFIEEFFRRIGNFLHGARLFRAFCNLFGLLVILRFIFRAVLFFLRGLIHDVSFECRRRFGGHIDTCAFHIPVHRDGRSRSRHIQIHDRCFRRIFRRKIHSDIIFRFNNRRTVSGIHRAVHRRFRYAAQRNGAGFIRRQRQAFVIGIRFIRTIKICNLREVHRIPDNARTSHIHRARHQRRRRLHIDFACDGNRTGRIQRNRRRYQSIGRILRHYSSELVTREVFIKDIHRRRLLILLGRIDRRGGIEFHFFKIFRPRRRDCQTPCINHTRSGNDHPLGTYEIQIPADFASLQRIHRTGDINLIGNKIHEIRRFGRTALLFEIHIRRVFIRNGKIGESVNPEIPLHLFRIHIGFAAFE